jgi:signal transduction histidine kinase
MQIIDNGKGFDPSRSQPVLGHGLSNIERRAHQIGGEVEFLSEAGQGTTLTVRLPLDSTEAPGELGRED